MDHEMGNNTDIGCGGNIRRRRRNIAVATALAVASSSRASTTCAFSSPPSIAPLAACKYGSRPNLFKDNGTLQSRSGRAGLLRRRSHHVLNMVSYLDIPTTTAVGVGMPPDKVNRGSGKASNRVINSPKKKEIRTFEINVEPDYDYFGLDADDFVTSSSSPTTHTNAGGVDSSTLGSNANDISIGIEQTCYDFDVPGQNNYEIDSEILYEGITTAEPKSVKTLEETAPVSLQKEEETPFTKTIVSEFISKYEEAEPSTTRIESINSKRTPDRRTKKEKPRSKSSTMPGFIKDEELDRHISNLELSRFPSSSPGSRKLKRIVRSKKAKLKRRQANSDSMYRKSASVPDSMIDYSREIHSIERVTPKEEKELGTKTQEAIRLQQLHDDLQNKYGRNPTDDEWAAAAGKMNVLAIQEAIQDGMAAKNQLVASNLRMVQRVVNLYIRNGLGSEYDAGDLMQDGTMALIRAAEKFEPERGFRFSTYAMYWIRSAVKRSQTSQSRIVTVPQRLHETHKRVAKIEVRLLNELGRHPTKAELAEACDITVLQLDRCQKAMAQVTFSLDAEVKNTLKPNSSTSRKDTMYDIVEGKVDETEYQRTQRLLMKDHLIGTLRRYLSPHEVDLLLLRYGLMDERALPTGMSGPLTIAEVSRLVGLKPDKVRRIIINSQKQLKHLMTDWEDFNYELA